MKDGKVTFRWKDYADNGKKKLMILDVFEFIRRFILHVMPPGFHRIRYYGFLSPRNRTHSLQLCRALLPQLPECSVAEDHEPQQADGGRDQDDYE